MSKHELSQQELASICKLFNAEREKGVKSNKVMDRKEAEEFLRNCGITPTIANAVLTDEENRILIKEKKLSAKNRYAFMYKFRENPLNFQQFQNFFKDASNASAQYKREHRVKQKAEEAAAIALAKQVDLQKPAKVAPAKEPAKITLEEAIRIVWNSKKVQIYIDSETGQWVKKIQKTIWSEE